MYVYERVHEREDEGGTWWSRREIKRVPELAGRGMGTGVVATVLQVEGAES